MAWGRTLCALRVQKVFRAGGPKPLQAKFRRPISSQRPLSTNQSSRRKTLGSGLGEFGFTWWVKPAIAFTPMQRSVTLLLAAVLLSSKMLAGRQELMAIKKHEKSQVNAVPCVAPIGARTIAAEVPNPFCDLCGQSDRPLVAAPPR